MLAAGVRGAVRTSASGSGALDRRDASAVSRARAEASRERMSTYLGLELEHAMHRNEPEREQWRTRWSSELKGDAINVVGGGSRAEVMFTPAEMSQYRPLVLGASTLPDSGLAYCEVHFKRGPVPRQFQGMSGFSRGDRLGKSTFIGVMATGNENEITRRGALVYKTCGAWGMRSISGKDALRADGKPAGSVPSNARGCSFGADERIGLLFDADARTLQFYRDGVRLQGACLASIPLASGLLRIAVDLHGGKGSTAILSCPDQPPQDALDGAGVHRVILSLRAPKDGLPARTRVHCAGRDGVYLSFARKTTLFGRDSGGTHSVQFEDRDGKQYKDNVENWSWPECYVLPRPSIGAMASTRRLSWAIGVHSLPLSLDLIEMAGRLVTNDEAEGRPMQMAPPVRRPPPIFEAKVPPARSQIVN